MRVVPQREYDVDHPLFSTRFVDSVSLRCSCCYVHVVSPCVNRLYSSRAQVCFAIRFPIVSSYLIPSVGRDSAMSAAETMALNSGGSKSFLKKQKEKDHQPNILGIVAICHSSLWCQTRSPRSSWETIQHQ